MKSFAMLQVCLGAALLSLGVSSSAIPAPAPEAAPAPASTPAPSTEPAAPGGTYTQNEIVNRAANFFGTATEGVARAIERVFADRGSPNAYITGVEGGGAVVIGLRYGDGELFMKANGDRPTKVYWQGPSVGFDFGANAAKVFVLVYNLPNAEGIYQRFPGVEGSAYFVAGIGVNYQQNGRIILAPMRTGVGLRAGANVGYLHYSKERNILPF
jgi:hypothetical protein